MRMLKAEYRRRGRVPQDVIDAVEFEKPTLAPGEVLVAVLAAPVNPSDVLTLTGEYGILPPLPAVGGYLIQLARLRGLKTVNVVRRESAVAAVETLGADVVLVDGDDLAERVQQATAGAAIKIGIDAVAGSATERIARCLGEGATLLNYGRMSGEPCTISPSSFIFRDLTLRGFWLARWFRNAAREQQVELLAQMTRLVANGTLHASIAASFPVSRIKEAVSAAAGGERDGKILVVPEH